MIHRYIKPEKRKARSQMMLSAKRAKRDRLGVDADTLRSRAIWDAKHISKL